MAQPHLLHNAGGIPEAIAEDKHEAYRIALDVTTAEYREVADVGQALVLAHRGLESDRVAKR